MESVNKMGILNVCPDQTKAENNMMNNLEDYKGSS